MEHSTLIVYYSWTGHTEKLAKELAATEGADLCRVLDARRPGALKAYTAGCFSALRMKPTPTRPLSADLSAYSRIVLMAPVWAGHPAPAILSALENLPPEKEMAVRLVAAGGSSNCEEKVRAAVEKRGCKLRRFETVRG